MKSKKDREFQALKEELELWKEYSRSLIINTNTFSRRLHKKANWMDYVSDTNITVEFMDLTISNVNLIKDLEYNRKQIRKKYSLLKKGEE